MKEDILSPVELATLLQAYLYPLEPNSNPSIPTRAAELSLKSRGLLALHNDGREAPDPDNYRTTCKGDAHVVQSLQLPLPEEVTVWQTPGGRQILPPPPTD